MIYRLSNLVLNGVVHVDVGGIPNEH
jgi:hypothetical protein